MTIRPKYRQTLLLAVDLLLMYAALLIALTLRSGRIPTDQVMRLHLRHFSLVFAGWIVVFYTLGLYRVESSLGGVLLARRFVPAVFVASFGTVAYFYLLDTAAIGPKTVMAIYIIAYAILFWTWRYGVSRLALRSEFRTGVGLVGVSASSLGIIQETRSRSGLGFDIRFVFGAPDRLHLPQGIEKLQSVAALADTVRRTGTELLVMGDRSPDSPELTRALFGLLDRRLRFMNIADFYELVIRRVPIGIIDESWFLEKIDLKAKRPYEFAKRLADIILSLAILLVTWPLWAVVAAVIRLTSPGPAFFVQTRLGRFDQPFRMIKFRTMRTNGNSHGPTLHADPRVTRVGAFLRSTRIDELPQVLNILRGEMSFIGPRPERPELAEQLERAIPFYRQRHLVKPGVTGWDQVGGEYHSPSVEDTYKKLQYDLYYLKNMSLFLDISIIFKTIITVLRREGR